MSDLQDAVFLSYLKAECGCLHPRPIGEGRYAAIQPFLFTAAIITGQMGDRTEYDNRWCYSSVETATAALEAWDGVGEPTGWHRHPATGRRRPEGDPTQEYVNK